MQWRKFKHPDYASERASVEDRLYEIRCYSGGRKWLTLCNGIPVDNESALRRDIAKAKVDAAIQRALEEYPFIDGRSIPRDRPWLGRKKESRIRRTKRELRINKHVHCSRCEAVDCNGGVVVVTPLVGKEHRLSLCGQCWPLVLMVCNIKEESQT